MFRNEFAVSCPTYLIMNAIKKGSIYKQKIKIRKEEQYIYIAQKYDDELGLILEKDVFL